MPCDAAQIGRFRQASGEAEVEELPKVGIAVTRRRGLIVSARAFPGAPCDDRALNEQLEKS
jgi:hypothetical protein